MKRNILLALCTLLLGTGMGLVVNWNALGGAGLLTPGAMSTAAVNGTVPLVPSTESGEGQDLSANGPLLEAGDAVLRALEAGDIDALAALVDPERGVTFTPYSTVDPHSDLTFLPDQLAQAGASGSTYIWGTTQGKGDAISLTLTQYLKTYVFNTDYTRAPVIGVDHVIASGNSLENVADAYPEARFLEYYFPGQDPEAEGLDWCALKLVFQEREGAYRLIGVIHSEWTT